MQLSLSLLSHTNVGKTTLARTLLLRDVGEVRDAPHVTEFAEVATLLESPEGDRLDLWDTPGLGDSARLVRRLRSSGQPIGWFLAQVWDRWRDRAFWSSQQALHNVREHADVVLYLVNAAEGPQAPYLEAEMALLDWLGKPAVVLLNQLGAPADPAAEAAELRQWQRSLQRGPAVRSVLPLDAFARCWVQESALWSAVAAALPPPAAAAMQRLAEAWWRQRQAVFDSSINALAEAVSTLVLARLPLDADSASGWRKLGAAVGLAPGAADAPTRAERALTALLDDTMRGATARLIALHGLGGEATGAVVTRVAAMLRQHRRVDEGRSALAAGIVSGALGGLTADLASGGLTLGGGMLAGALLGALGGAGVARGVNLVRGVERDEVAFAPEALPPLLELALLRYLAVAHFGRGRGDWADGEAPAHWAAVVQEALAVEAGTLAAVPRLAAAELPSHLAGLLARSAGRALAKLYPGCRDVCVPRAGGAADNPPP